MEAWPSFLRAQGMNFRDILKAQLPTDEGYRKKPYRDTVGKLTIGIGRNLDDVGVNDGEIQLMLDNDIERAVIVASRVVPTFETLSDMRKAVVCNMAFNMGERVFGGFHDTLQAIAEERWDDAADHMLQSRWASQVGARAARLAQAMRDG